MTAKIRLDNVGGLRGSHTFKFEKGRLNIIQGTNSSCKSSITKGLTLVLTAPTNFDILKSPGEDNNEAMILGLVSSDKNPREGIVNIHADQAAIELEVDSQKERLVLKKTGSVAESPKRGNINFMYAGALSKDSRIFRELRAGKNDFKWVVTKLSLASYYDSIVNDIITPKLTDIEALYSNAEARERGIRELKKRKDKLEEEITPVGDKIKKLTESTKGNADLAIKRNSKSSFLEEKRKYLADLKRDNKNHEVELHSANIRLAGHNKKIQGLKKELTELLTTQKTSPTVGSDKLQEEITALLQDRTEIEARINIFQPALEAIEETNSGICPLCEEGKLSLAEAKKKINSLEKEREKLNEEIIIRNRKKQKIEDEQIKTKERIDQVKEELESAENDLKVEMKAGKISFLQARVDGYKRQMAEKEREIIKLEDELKEIDKKLDPQIAKKINELQNNAGGLKKELELVEDEISNARVTINDELLFPSEAMKICEAWLEYLNDLKSFCIQKLEDQQRKARDEFNRVIGVIMDKLNFKDLKDIKLNKENQLFVERVDPSTKRLVMQDVKTLGTGEKLTIAIVLQIALKETYLPGTPFFILDDIEDFDPDRKDRVFAYLKEKAKERGWYVIVTELVKGEKGVKIVYD